jgi:hypothetical protein
MITRILGSLQGDFGLKFSSIPKQPQQHFSILFSINKTLLQIFCIFLFLAEFKMSQNVHT